MSQRNMPVFVFSDFAEKPSLGAVAVRKGGRVVVTSASHGVGARVERDWINSLTASRKEEREALAMALECIAHGHGADVLRRYTSPSPGYSGAGIDLHFSLNGVGAMVDIDNLHGGTYALISWFNTERGPRDFTTRFCVNTGNLTQTRRHHKSTSCPNDWYSLAMMLDAGLYLAARGEAFEPVE